MCYHNNNKMDSKAKWVPKWKLDEQAKIVKAEQADVEMQKGIEKTEDNFPSLVPAPTTMRVWGGEKTFSELAKEWHSDTEQKLENEKNMAEFEKSKDSSNLFVMPTFTHKHYFTEKAESVDETDEEEEQGPAPTDSVWTLVDRRKMRRRKEKDMEEIANRPPTPEENETTWPEHNLNETCWDDRR